MSLEYKILGCLLGASIGDALGLSFEGISYNKLNKLNPNLDNYSLVFNKGMFSDDTEHICMVSEAIIDSNGNIELFKKVLARKFKLWLLLLPAGIGFATLKSIIKLLIGFSPDKSGIFSAGNGPAMRASIIGVCYGSDFEKMKDFVKVSTLITHKDPKALNGSLAIALAAYMNTKNDFSSNDFLNNLSILVSDNEFNNLIEKTIESVKKGEPTQDYANSLGLQRGVTGYIYHTVPIVIHCWIRNRNNFSNALKEIILCGGDTDTTASILGGIIGTGMKETDFPKQYLDNIIDYPRSILWIKNLADSLSHSIELKKKDYVKLSIPLVFFRNIIFIFIVLIHGFKRLFTFFR